MLVEDCKDDNNGSGYDCPDEEGDLAPERPSPPL